MNRNPWRLLVALGVAAPLISLLFIEHWNPRVGVVLNLQKANVILYEAETVDKACLARPGAYFPGGVHPQTGVVIPETRIPAGTPETCTIRRPFGVRWRWIAVSGIALAAIGFVIRRSQA